MARSLSPGLFAIVKLCNRKVEAGPIASIVLLTGREPRRLLSRHALPHSRLLRAQGHHRAY